MRTARRPRVAGDLALCAEQLQLEALAAAEGSVKRPGKPRHDGKPCGRWLRRDDLLSLWCAMTACERKVGTKGVYQLKSGQGVARAPLADATTTTPPTVTRTDNLAEAALKSLHSSVQRNGVEAARRAHRGAAVARAGIAAARGRRAPRRNEARARAGARCAHPTSAPLPIYFRSHLVREVRASR